MKSRGHLTSGPIVHFLSGGFAGAKSVSIKSKTVTDAVTGSTILKDTERRKVGNATEDAVLRRNSRLQQLALALFVLVPHSLAWRYQTNPTVPEQLNEWFDLTWAQVTAGAEGLVARLRQG